MATKQLIDIFYNRSEGSLGPLGSKGTVGSKGPLDLCSLEKYMLTHTFFDSFKETDKIQEPAKTELIIPVSKPLLEVINPVSKQPIKTRFRAFLKDSLFWCMYVHSHGHTAFETHKAIGTNMLNLMMTEKRLISDFFNKEDNKTALKLSNHKITNIKINEIKCDLMTKPMLTSIEALIPCCVYWKCPIYVDLGNKTFLHFVPNTYVSDEDTASADPNAVLLYTVEGRFELEMDQEKKAQIIAKLRQNCYKIPHYEKPMMGIGTYKTDELHYLYDMVIGTKEDKKMKKHELYDAIAIKCAQGIMIRTMF